MPTPEQSKSAAPNWLSYAGLLVFALTGLFRILAPLWAGGLQASEALFMDISGHYFTITALLAMKAGQAPGYFLFLHGAEFISENIFFLRALSAVFAILAAGALYKTGVLFGKPIAGLTAAIIWLLSPSIAAASSQISPLMFTAALLFWALYFALGCAFSDEPEMYATPFCVAAVASFYAGYVTLIPIALFLAAWHFWPQSTPKGLNPFPTWIVKRIILWQAPGYLAMAFQRGLHSPEGADAFASSALSGLAFPLRAGSTLLSADGVFHGMVLAGAGIIFFGAVALAGYAQKNKTPGAALLAAALTGSALIMGVLGYAGGGQISPLLGLLWAGPGLAVLLSGLAKTNPIAFSVFALGLVLTGTFQTTRDISKKDARPDWNAAVDELNLKLTENDGLIIEGSGLAPVVRHYLNRDIEILVVNPALSNEPTLQKGGLLPLFPREASEEQVADLFIRHPIVWRIGLQGKNKSSLPSRAKAWLQENTRASHIMDASYIHLSSLRLKPNLSTAALENLKRIKNGRYLDALCQIGDAQKMAHIFSKYLSKKSEKEATEAVQMAMQQILKAARDGLTESGGAPIPQDAANLYFWMADFFNQKGWSAGLQAVDAATSVLIGRNYSAWQSFWSFGALPENLQPLALSFARKEDARLTKEANAKNLRKDIWTAYLQLKPGSVSTRLNLLGYRLETDDCAAAFEQYQAVISLDPENSHLNKYKAHFPCGAP